MKRISFTNNELYLLIKGHAGKDLKQVYEDNFGVGKLNLAEYEIFKKLVDANPKCNFEELMAIKNKNDEDEITKNAYEKYLAKIENLNLEDIDYDYEDPIYEMANPSEPKKKSTPTNVGDTQVFSKEILEPDSNLAKKNIGNTTNTKNENVKILQFKKLLQLAAACVILSSGYIGFNYYTKVIDTDQITENKIATTPQEFLELPMLFSNTRSVDNESDEPWETAIEKKEYDKAIAILDTMLPNPRRQCYLGIAYCKKAEPDFILAETYLQQSLASKVIMVSSTANLYLGAIKLNQNKLNEARKCFSEVKSPAEKPQADFFLRNIK